jgi:hypothetical protein
MEEGDRTALHGDATSLFVFFAVHVAEFAGKAGMN